MIDDIWLAEDVTPLGQLLLRSARRTRTRTRSSSPTRACATASWRTRLEVGRSLLGLGVQAGDHVGVLMTNHPDLVRASSARR